VRGWDSALRRGVLPIASLLRADPAPRLPLISVPSVPRYASSSLSRLRCRQSAGDGDEEAVRISSHWFASPRSFQVAVVMLIESTQRLTTRQTLYRLDRTVRVEDRDVDYASADRDLVTCGVEVVVRLDEAHATVAACRNDEAAELHNLIAVKGRTAAFVFPAPDLYGRLHSRIVGSRISCLNQKPLARESIRWKKQHIIDDILT
jgi:hypothetical protein